MAHHNSAILYARVAKKPSISQDNEGNYIYGMVYVHVVRGLRDAHDHIKYIRHDQPLVISKDPAILREMAGWTENDIVMIHGFVASRDIDKPSYCPNEECKDEDGHSPVKNIARGNLIYINPITAYLIKRYDNREDSIRDVVAHREISNMVYILGTLVSEPKKFITKKGLPVTQYKLAINRKYHVRTDNPDHKTDWPWVKSYGDQAVEDKLRLHIGSDVYIDGFIQARTILRTTKCRCCGQFYRWQDHCMEIVPYAVEYGKFTYYSDEELESMFDKTVEDIKQSVFAGNDKPGEDDNTDDLKVSGSDDDE